jgi:hypothetical protein
MSDAAPSRHASILGQSGFFIDVGWVLADALVKTSLVKEA